jgi:DNA polymerase-3 subunit chi
MPEIGFYHLTRMDVTAALPPLLARTLAAGERALVLCGAASRVTALDDALWLTQNPDWLAHGTAATPHPEWQPVFITPVETNPAGAKFLFLTDGAETANPDGYTRIFDLFDGNDEDAVAAARARWKAAKAAGYPITYWKQGANGWEKAGS